MSRHLGSSEETKRKLIRQWVPELIPLTQDGTITLLEAHIEALAQYLRYARRRAPRPAEAVIKKVLAKPRRRACWPEFNPERIKAEYESKLRENRAIREVVLASN